MIVPRSGHGGAAAPRRPSAPHPARRSHLDATVVDVQTAGTFRMVSTSRRSGGRTVDQAVTWISVTSPAGSVMIRQPVTSRRPSPPTAVVYIIGLKAMFALFV